MKNVTFNLRAVNVPRDLQHMRRADELQQVVDYLRVDAVTASNLAMVHMGTDAPPLDQQDLLWVRKTAEGLPAGLFLRALGEWKRATPFIVESETSNLRIVTGTGTATDFAEAADTAKTYPIATFNPDFEAIPMVFISVTGGSLHTTAATHAAWSYKIIPNKDKWELELKCTVSNVGAPKTLDISWMAIGVIE
jgi:hypothetical protein